MRFWLLFLSTFFLVHCSSAPDPEGQRQRILESAVLDPSDTVLAQAVQEFLKDGKAPLASNYQFARHDLDGDGRRDAIVLFQTPHGYWCDLYGCTMLVMKANNYDFELVNSIQPVRAPLLISHNQTHGWSDLITRVSGRWDDAKDVAMSFDGTRYPSNPAALPPHNKGSKHQYVSVLDR